MTSGVGEGHLTDEELAKWEKRCEQAKQRAARRCMAREELRIDARELRPLLAAVRGQGEALRRRQDQLEQALVLLADAIPDPKGPIDSPQWNRRMDRLAASLDPDTAREFNDCRDTTADVGALDGPAR